MIMLFTDMLKPLTKRSLVYWWSKCVYIEDSSCFWIRIPVNSAAICSFLDLILFAIEPHDGIKSTRDHTFWRLFLCLRLY